MKKGGCNDNYVKHSKPQAPGRMNPSSFDRKNMAKGGVNNMMLGKVSGSLGKGKR